MKKKKFVVFLVLLSFFAIPLAANAATTGGGYYYSSSASKNAGYYTARSYGPNKNISQVYASVRVPKGSTVLAQSYHHTEANTNAYYNPNNGTCTIINGAKDYTGWSYSYH